MLQTASNPEQVLMHVACVKHAGSAELLLLRRQLCIALTQNCRLNVHAWLQSQRQLQLSLEAHGRYITSLIEREGLQHRLLPQLVAAAGPSIARHVPALAALAASMPQGSSAQTSDQQTHYMPLSASGASDFSPQQLLAGGFGSLPNPSDLNGNPSPKSSPDAADAAQALEASPVPLTRHATAAAPSNPFATINQNTFGEPSSPGLLLNTDLQAAAAAWDDHQRHILTGPGGSPLGAMPVAPVPAATHSPTPAYMRPLDPLLMSSPPYAGHLMPLQAGPHQPLQAQLKQEPQ